MSTVVESVPKATRKSARLPKADKVAQKKRGRKPREKVYSLVSDTPTNLALPVESFIVRLKVNRMMFNQIFKQGVGIMADMQQTPYVNAQNAGEYATPSTGGMITANFGESNPVDRTSTSWQNGTVNSSNNNTNPNISNDSQNATTASFGGNFRCQPPADFLYTRLSIPDLYPEVMPELEKEKAVFNDYQQVNLSLVNQQLNNQSTFKKVLLILPTFETGWPEQSPYACWNCTEKFEVPPVGLPIVHESKHQIEYHLEGNFCSYNCAARHLFDRTSGSNLWQRYDLLNLLYHQINPDAPLEQKVELAPPYLSLKKFGGKLTIAEYRSAQQDNRAYKVYKYPLKPCLYLLEESRPMPKKKTKQYVHLEQDKVKKIENKYKLFRKKPLPTKSSRIDQCLGIKYI